MNNISRVLIAAAATSAAIFPVVAEAATRASAGTFASASLPGFGRSANGEKAADATDIIVGVLATGAIIGGIVVAFDGNDKGQSPGT